MNYSGGKIVSEGNSGFIKYVHTASSFLSYELLYPRGEEVNHIIKTYCFSGLNLKAVHLYHRVFLSVEHDNSKNSDNLPEQN